MRESLKANTNTGWWGGPVAGQRRARGGTGVGQAWARGGPWALWHRVCSKDEGVATDRITALNC